MLRGGGEGPEQAGGRQGAGRRRCGPVPASGSGGPPPPVAAQRLRRAAAGEEQAERGGRAVPGTRCTRSLGNATKGNTAPPCRRKGEWSRSREAPVPPRSRGSRPGSIPSPTAGLGHPPEVWASPRGVGTPEVWASPGVSAPLRAGVTSPVPDEGTEVVFFFFPKSPFASQLRGSFAPQAGAGLDLKEKKTTKNSLTSPTCSVRTKYSVDRLFRGSF